MRPYPVIGRNKVLEIGYRGHARWQIAMGAHGEIQAPVIIDRFHIFPVFEMKLPATKIADTATRKAKENKKYDAPTEGYPWETCTISETMMIALTYDVQKALVMNRKKVYVQNEHFYTICTPPNPHEFFTFTDWKVVPAIKYPIPELQRENAIKAALIYLRQMQYTLDAYIRYWDTEGRPPISQLDVEEVRIKYGNETCSRTTE